MSLAPGTRLGPYEVVSAIGAGGMGEVYRARDTRLGRDVAIKILPQHLTDNPDARQRFEREARAISSLNHPHICVLHDIGHQDGIDFLVMEYLEGETLAKRLEKGPLATEELLRVGIEIADAMEKAHRQGILHRDLKPANMMLTKMGAKLMDFGLAKAAGGAAPVNSLTQSLNRATAPVTAEGTIVGTFQYMSPEQVEGKEADARSDIFSFGAVLYEMTTGKRAFDGKSAASVIAAILEREPPPVSSLQPMSPPALDRTVKICLAKDPDERFQSAHDVKLQLEWIREAGSRAGVSAPVVVPRKNRERIAWAAILVIAVAISTVVGRWPRRAAVPQPVINAALLTPDKVSLNMFGGTPALSPDGTKLAFIGVDQQGNSMLYVRPLNSSTAQALSGTQGASDPFWSPDSRALGFFADSKLKRIDAEGGSALVLADIHGFPAGAAWSATGIILYETDLTHVILQVPAVGGTPSEASKLAAASGSLAGEGFHAEPHFLPDGKHFLFLSMPDQNVCIGELGSLEHKVLLEKAVDATYASGYLLFVRGENLLAQPFSVSKFATTGAPVPLVEDVAFNFRGGTLHNFSASDTGLLVFQSGPSGPQWPLTWYSRNGKPLGTLGKNAGYGGPTVSPDGRRVAAEIHHQLGQSDIWVFDLARGTESRLTFDGHSRYPVWSPDSKEILYTDLHSDAGNHEKLYIKPADNSGPPKTLVADIGPAAWGSVSADGRYLAYMRVSDHPGWTFDIWGVDLKGNRKPFPVVRNRFIDGLPSLSPNGKWLSYISNETGRDEVYITAFPAGGAKWQVSTEGGLTPRWRGDGKELFFSSLTDDRIMAVNVATSANSISLGAPHMLFQAEMQIALLGSYDVTSDGKKFLLNSGNAPGDGKPLTLVTNWPALLKKQ